MSETQRIILVSGARPNFMKIAPLVRALDSSECFHPVIVHTGQHYDDRMSHRFFKDLGIRPPDVNLEVGSAGHAVQTATVMIRFDAFLDTHDADMVVVVGDVNSTIACALTATKRGIPVAHVEAGLRSYDREMPEEVNRILTDSIADLLFTTEPDGQKNLRKEGVPAKKIHFIGNVMVDTLFHHREEAKRIDPPCNLPEKFALVTVHRPSNVDGQDDLKRITDILLSVSEQLPIVFPVHPRTSAKLEEYALAPMLESSSALTLLPPLGYLAFLRLMLDATVILTDSGGIQEESTALGIPCITLRENTERPITVTNGTNEVCGTDGNRIRGIVADVLRGRGKEGRIPDLWDGEAAVRFVAHLESFFN